ncbi:MAG TPA: chromate transporter [Deltaproteobacteria bacterium]|nr:chromate transporter [Deltaproteobacteria bacterium]
MNSPTDISKKKLSELAALFLKLGTIAFGGPAPHIAMMEEEVVRRKKWLSHDDFLDLLGATNLIPGPNSTEMAIHIGHRRAGFVGLIVAGLCFIFPAVMIVWSIAWAYVRFGTLPEIQNILYGIKPVIIAIVVCALWRLGQTAIKTKTLALFCLMAILGSALGINEIFVIFGTGVLALIWHWLRTWKNSSRLNGFLWFFISSLWGTPTLLPNLGVESKLPAVFLIFLKIGSVLFGSGYVLLAFLQADFVDHRHWLSQSQLLDAIAVGQFTPGPVFTAATFVGYIIAGNQGALWATLGIFIPSFVFVALSGPFVPRLRKSPMAGAFLNGVNLASLALMAVVSWQLGKTALIDWPTVMMAIGSFVLLLLFRLNSAWLVLGGGLLGFLI